MANAGSVNPYHDSVYHYTNLCGIVSIMQSMKIKASSANSAYRVRGQYFTSLGPNTDPDFLRNNNWDGAAKAKDPHRTEFYVQIPKKHLPKLKSVGSFSEDGKVVNIYVNEADGQRLDLSKMTVDPPLFGYTRPPLGTRREITRDDIPALQRRLSKEVNVSAKIELND